MDPLRAIIRLAPFFHEPREPDARFIKQDHGHPQRKKRHWIGRRCDDHGKYQQDDDGVRARAAQERVTEYSKIYQDLVIVFGNNEIVDRIAEDIGAEERGAFADVLHRLAALNDRSSLRHRGNSLEQE